MKRRDRKQTQRAPTVSLVDDDGDKAKTDEVVLPCIGTIKSSLLDRNHGFWLRK